MYDERFFLTREMLYQKVWGTPATKLSKEIGISDVMLGKICRKLDVQKPLWAIGENWKQVISTRINTTGNLKICEKLEFIGGGDRNRTDE